jgi:hypothetical protein
MLIRTIRGPTAVMASSTGLPAIRIASALAVPAPAPKIVAVPVAVRPFRALLREIVIRRHPS